MALADIVSIIRRGGTAILPTDTVYGIFCLYTKPRAIARIYREKGRDRSKPLPLVVGSIDQLVSLLKVNRKFAERISRLPVTLKGFPRRKVNRAFLSPDGKIAVRLVDHRLTAAVARAAGPMAGTSANRSGEEAPTSAKNLRIGADIIVDTGATKFRRSTTILDIETGEITRRGAAARKIEVFLKLIKAKGGSDLWKGKKS